MSIVSLTIRSLSLRGGQNFRTEWSNVRESKPRSVGGLLPHWPHDCCERRAAGARRSGLPVFPRVSAVCWPRPGSGLLRLTLSATAPGDFRPVACARPHAAPWKGEEPWRGGGTEGGPSRARPTFCAVWKRAERSILASRRPRRSGQARELGPLREASASVARLRALVQARASRRSALSGVLLAQRRRQRNAQSSITGKRRQPAFGLKRYVRPSEARARARLAGGGARGRRLVPREDEMAL